MYTADAASGSYKLKEYCAGATALAAGAASIAAIVSLY